jgi:CBS domain containing-hemolysin-like protein
MIGQDFLLTFLGVFSLIAINAFFVTAEFSIVSVRRSRIGQLVKNGDLQAQTVQSLQRSIERLLSTTQLGITLSSLALGWVGEKTMAVTIMAAIAKLPLPVAFSSEIAHSLAVPISFILLVYLQIVLGELCPKSVALLYPEQLAKFFGPLSVVIARIFRPFISILNLSTRLLLKCARIEYKGQGLYQQVTSEELQLIIATEIESTGLEAEERQLLKNVFDFRKDKAIDVMITRTNIEFLSLNSTFSELLQKVAIKGYSCYPVIGDSLDDIRGIINYKNLALAWSKSQLTNDSMIEPWLEPVNFISESTSLNELLPFMQRSHQKMVIVLDEFGGTLGSITLHDLIAEIVGDGGEIAETGLDTIQNLGAGTFLAPAQMNLEEVNEQLKLDLPRGEHYNTLGGFLLDKWQKIPIQGEQLEYENLIFTVTSVEENRLEEIKIKIHLL